MDYLAWSFNQNQSNGCILVIHHVFYQLQKLFSADWDKRVMT